MRPRPIAYYDPSVREAADTSPAKLGRRKVWRHRSGALPANDVPSDNVSLYEAEGCRRRSANQNAI